MEITEYSDTMKEMEQHILDVMANELNSNEYIAKYDINVIQQIIQEKNQYLIDILHLILKIANNHHRTPCFFSKIEQILLSIKNEIKQSLSNYSIFNIFKSNKRILLFLIEKEILIIDKNIMLTISSMSNDYYDYFFPEITSFFSGETKDNSSIFDKKRERGENDNYICQLIQNDSIDEFVKYATQTNLNLSQKVEHSIFETNKFLLKNKPTLIEYAVFFGSTMIFNYLRLNNVEMHSSLWLYAVHSNCSDIIHILEENQIKMSDKLIQECYMESVKCFHNHIANYIKDNFLNVSIQKMNEINSKILKTFNFEFIQFDVINESIFIELCRKDYFSLVKLALKDSNLNVNAKCLNKTALCAVAEKGNQEIFQFLLSIPEIDVNMKSINDSNISMKFYRYIFEFHFKSLI